MPKTNQREWLAIDPVALTDLTASHRLSAETSFILYLLCCFADYGTNCWTGTIHQISQDCRTSSRTVAKAIEYLAAEGLVQIQRPFKPGPSSGRIHVVAREEVARGRVATKGKRGSNPPPVVYAIEAGGLTKIGTTIDLGKRVSSLQTGSPMELVVLAVMPGDAKVERFIHERLDHCRQRGEWFALSDADREWLIHVMTQHADSPDTH